MRRISFIGVLVFAACISISNRGESPLIRRMDSLLDRREYFRLEREMNLHSLELPTFRRIYFEAILDEAFNRNRACIALVDSALSLAAPDSLKAKLLMYESLSYFRNGQYAFAARADSLVLHTYKNAVDGPTFRSTESEWAYRNALRKEPPQEILRGSGTKLRWRGDQLHLIEIPVRWPGKTVEAIVDTRANISCMTPSYSKKLHLRMMNVSYQAGSPIVSTRFAVRIGVADSIRIGGILIRHAVFQVLPDSDLWLAPVHFQVNVAIGMPILSQLQEFRIYSDGNMVIPAAPEYNALHNMAFDGQDPVVLLTSGSDSLLYYFDSGAANTNLFYSYFLTHREAVGKGPERFVTVAGAGGMKIVGSRQLPSIRLTLGATSVTLNNIDVLTEKMTSDERFYGNIGVDFIHRFHSLVFDTRYMYLEGERVNASVH